MTLAFLNQSLWPILILALSALIIHLLSKTPAHRFEFPAMQFIIQVEKQSSRSTYLKDILLLTLRTILLLSILIAALLPFIPEKKIEDSPSERKDLYLLLDVSASMMAQINGEELFKIAKEKMVQTVKQQESDRLISLIVCGKQSQLIAPLSFEHSKIINLIEDQKIDLSHSVLDTCLQFAKSQIIKRRKADTSTNEDEQVGVDTLNAEVVIFTDFAQHALHTPPTSILGKQITLRIIDLWSKETNRDNFSIQEKQPLFSFSNNRFTFSSEVKSFASSEAIIKTRFMLGEDLLSTQNIQLNHFENKELKFSAQAEKNQRKPDDIFSISLAQNDAILQDNMIQFPKIKIEKQTLLIVDGENHPSPFNDEIYFLNQAILKSQTLKQLFQTTHVNIEKLAVEDIKSADVIVLANVARIPEVLIQILRHRLSTGVGLFITSGDQLDIDWYNKNLKGFLPGHLRGIKEYRQLENPQLKEQHRLGVKDKNHPIFRNLLKEKNLGLGLDSVLTHSHILIDADPQMKRQALIQLDNNNPFLLESLADNSRILMLTTSIDQEWSDFSIRPGFLPLIQEILQYLTRRKNESHLQMVEAGEEFNLKLDDNVTQVTLISPDGGKNQVKINTVNNQNNIRFKTKDLGLHQLFITEKNHPKTPYIIEFSSIFPHEESDTAPFKSNKSSENTILGQLMSASSDKQKLYPYLLVFAIFVFFLESYFSSKDPSANNTLMNQFKMLKLKITNKFNF